MRTREGFSVIQDSLSAFYDCLCVGMSSGDAISTGMLGPDANGNDATGTGTWGLDADGIGTSGGDDANLNPSAPVQSVEQSGGVLSPFFFFGMQSIVFSYSEVWG